MTIIGKHAVVTGGGSGIGAEIAKGLAQLGACVTIVGRNAQPLEAQHLPYELCDVTDADQVGRAFEAARAKQGPITVVVANAGAAHSESFAKTEPDLLEAMFAINTLGVFNAWQASYRDMLEAKWGRMIAIASTAGLRGYSYVSAYSASKHAVLGLTRSLALELARTGITVNSICPGYTQTPLLDRTISNIQSKTGSSLEDAEKVLLETNPQERFIEPKEVSDTVNWLCTAAAGSVNGQAICLAGGPV